MRNYIVGSCVILVLSIIYHYNVNKATRSIIEYPRERYDYIVVYEAVAKNINVHAVGAGTAGCVIASQLSEVPNTTVLLIEAGGYFNWLSTVPLAAPMMQGSTVDWTYRTEPQYYSSRGLINFQQFWPRGKGLGGSGQLNYLVHSFGIPEDYDNWPSEWSYADLYSYFEKVAKKMHLPGTTPEGPLVDTFKNLDTSALTGNVTIQKSSSTIWRGARWSTYHAYLQNAWNRKNLHIITDTLVTKIHIDDDSIAHGVDVRYRDGTPGRVEARSEIIVCAGAVNTPQLLMISGIGPKDELEKHSIAIIKDLPQVGKNLFDHLNMPVYVNLEAPVSITLRKMQTVAEVIKYFVFETGILATNGVMGTARVNGSGVVLFGVASTDEKLLKDVSNFETNAYRSIFPAHNDTSHEGFIYLASCLQPKSRGNVTLKSKNMLEPPRIEPAYLEHGDDLVCTRRAINLALETLETEEFRSLGAKVHVPDLEECLHLRQTYLDPEYTECVVRTVALTSHHPGGTCRIGTNTNDSVVDNQLRIHGIKNLRVMDASVLPSPISGTPNSVIIAMAERAVDLILKQSKKISFV